jgi:anti-anti-sigma factor
MPTTPIESTTSTGRGEGQRHITDLPHLTMSVHRTAERVVITLAGEMDIAIEEAVRDLVIAAVVDSGLTALHVDVTGITFFGSSGLSSVLSARETALDHGLDFTLGVGDAAPVARLIALFGLDAMLDIRPHQITTPG